MNKILIGLLIGALTATFSLDAEAQRRLGGGRNIGKQTPQAQQTTPPAATPAQTPNAAAAVPAAGAATAAARSPMRNLLIGAAAGLGLMALASWLGFGETMATILLFALIGMVILMVIGFIIRRRMGTQPAYQGAGGAAPGSNQQRMEPQPMQRSALEASASARSGSAMDHFMRGGAVNPASPWGIPAGFDTEGFVANARTYFGKLQSAWQTGNLDELADFTTNDMFITLTHELRGRGDAPKSIDVDAMETRLLGVESTPAEHLASVRFTGSVRVDGEVEKVDEVWNLSKAADGKTGWLLAGIQQIA